MENHNKFYKKNMQDIFIRKIVNYPAVRTYCTSKCKEKNLNSHVRGQKK